MWQKDFTMPLRVRLMMLNGDCRCSSDDDLSLIYSSVLFRLTSRIRIRALLSDAPVRFAFSSRCTASVATLIA